MDVLKKRGYVIFRNVIGKNDIINAQNNVNKKTVNYIYNNYGGSS